MGVDLSGILGTFTDDINSAMAAKRKNYQLEQATAQEMQMKLVEYLQKQREGRLKAILETGKQTGQVGAGQLGELQGSGYEGMFSPQGSLQERPHVVEDRQLDRTRALLSLAQGRQGLAKGERDLSAPSRAQGLAAQFTDPDKLMEAGVGEGLTTLPQLANFRQSRLTAQERQRNADRNFNRLAGSMGESQGRQDTIRRSEEEAVQTRAALWEGMQGENWNQTTAREAIARITASPELMPKDKQSLLLFIMKSLEED